MATKCGIQHYELHGHQLASWFPTVMWVQRDRYHIGECMGINKSTCIMASKNLHVGYPHCHISQMLMFGGFVKARESLYTRVTVWVSTILYHVDNSAMSPKCPGSCMLFISYWFWNRNIVEYPYPVGIHKCKIFIIDTRMEVQHEEELNWH